MRMRSEERDSENKCFNSDSKVFTVNASPNGLCERAVDCRFEIALKHTPFNERYKISSSVSTVTDGSAGKSGSRSAVSVCSEVPKRTRTEDATGGDR